MMKHALYTIGVMCTLVLALICNVGCKQPSGNEPAQPLDTIPGKQDTVPVTPPADPKGNQLVVYECNERLFASSNALQSVRNYLPVLQQMQVNVLWLMPVQPRGEVNTVWSPYCLKDYTAISPDMGTLADMQNLVNDAHSRGMKVILDWVANHTAWDHPWVTEHPTWYTAAQTTSEQGWKDVTFLDYGKTEVQDAMCEAMLYWINNADIDGFRCDYAEGVPNAFWQKAIAAIRQVKPAAILLAESSKPAHYTDGFDWIYSWNYLYAVEDLYKGTKSLTNLLSVSQQELTSTPNGKDRLRYVTTHDATAEYAPSTFFHTADGMLSAFCLTAFLGGVPMIYSSQDIGDLSKINFCAKTLTPLSFSGTNPTVLKYQQLMKAYVATATARLGAVENFSSDKAAVFTRTYGDQSILVMVNTTSSVQVTPLPMDWQKIEATEVLPDVKVTTPKSATLTAYEYRIYSK